MANVLFGDWDKAGALLTGMHALMSKNLEFATKKNAVTLRDTMKKTINAGRPEWPPLQPKTIARKGSSKPLIDTGDMRNSINDQMLESGGAFIGIPRAAKNRKGGDLVNIGAVHVYGSKTRNIPARDFILPAYNAVREKMIGRYRDAVKAGLRGEAYRGK